MRIEHIEITGFKSEDRVLRLSGSDAVIGAARSGKSSVRMALEFLATGRVSELGRTLADVGILVRDREMTVGVAWDDGSCARRGMSRKGNGWTGTAWASWLGQDAGQTEAEEAIRARFGATDAEAAQNINFDSFARLTGPKQAEAINALLDASGQDTDQLAEHALTLTAMRLSNPRESALSVPATRDAWELVRKGSLAQASQAVQDAFYSAGADLAPVIAEQGLTDACRWAAKRKARAAADVKSRRAARSEFEDRLATIDVPKGTLDEIDAERDRLTGVVKDAEIRIEQHRERAEEIAKAQAAVAKAQATCDEIVSAVGGDGQDPEAIALELETEAEAMRSHAGQLQEPETTPRPERCETDPEALARADALEDEAARIDVEANDQDPGQLVLEDLPKLLSLDSFEAAVAGAEEARRRATEQDPWSEVRLLANRIDEDSAESEDEGEGEACYPYEEHTDALRFLADKYGPNLKRLAGNVQIAENGLETARKQNEAIGKRIAEIKASNEAATQAHEEALARVKALREAAVAKRQEARQIRTTALAAASEENHRREEAWKAENSERTVQADAVVQRRRKLLSDAADHERRAKDIRKDWSEAQALLREAQARLDAIERPEDLDIAELEGRIAEAKVASETLDDRRRLVQQADARQRELLQITNELEAAQAEETVARAIDWALPKVRDLDLFARVAPLVSRMRTFMAGAGLDEDPFIEAAKGKVRYGWVAGSAYREELRGKKLDGRALSGAEALLWNAAFWNAIVGVRDPHTKVLALEVDDLDPLEAERFFAGCREVGADNLLVFTNRTLPIPASWARHELAQIAAEVAA